MNDKRQPEPVDVYVGMRIASRRIELGMNQSQLGKPLGVSFQQVQKYEKGTNRVSASKLANMAKVLNVPVVYFFGDHANDGNDHAAVDVTAMHLYASEAGRIVAERWAGLSGTERTVMASIANAYVKAKDNQANGQD